MGGRVLSTYFSNSNVEFTKKQINMVVAHNLAKTIILNTCSDILSHVPTYIKDLIFNELIALEFPDKN